MPVRFRLDELLSNSLGRFETDLSHALAKIVDAPDGEHDLEDVEEHHRGVESIILNASIFEKPDQVVKQQNMRAEVLKKQMRDLEGDM